MTPQRKQEKKPAFKPTVEGLTKFLEDFFEIWAIFKILYEGPVGQTEFVGTSIRQMEVMKHSAFKVFDGPADNYAEIIGKGVALMRRIEDYIEEIVEASRVDGFFEDTKASIQKLSAETWGVSETTLLRLHAEFHQAAAANDLEDVVVAYNNLARELSVVLEFARQTAKEREEANRRAETARREVEKLQKDRAKGKGILAQLSA